MVCAPHHILSELFPLGAWDPTERRAFIVEGNAVVPGSLPSLEELNAAAKKAALETATARGVAAGNAVSVSLDVKSPTPVASAAPSGSVAPGPVPPPVASADMKDVKSSAGSGGAGSGGSYELPQSVKDAISAAIQAAKPSAEDQKLTPPTDPSTVLQKVEALKPAKQPKETKLPPSVATGCIVTVRESWATPQANAPARPTISVAVRWEITRDLIAAFLGGGKTDVQCRISITNADPYTDVLDNDVLVMTGADGSAQGQAGDTEEMVHARRRRSDRARKEAGSWVDEHPSDLPPDPNAAAFRGFGSKQFPVVPGRSYRVSVVISYRNKSNARVIVANDPARYTVSDGQCELLIVREYKTTRVLFDTGYSFLQLLQAIALVQGTKPAEVAATAKRMRLTSGALQYRCHYAHPFSSYAHRRPFIVRNESIAVRHLSILDTIELDDRREYEGFMGWTVQLVRTPTSFPMFLTTAETKQLGWIEAEPLWTAKQLRAEIVKVVWPELKAAVDELVRWSGVILNRNLCVLTVGVWCGVL